MSYLRIMIKQNKKCDKNFILSNIMYVNKYIKYKNKYLFLKNRVGGSKHSIDPYLLSYIKKNDINEVRKLVTSENINVSVSIKQNELIHRLIFKKIYKDREIYSDMSLSLFSYALLTMDNINYDIIDYFMEIGALDELSESSLLPPLILILENENIKKEFIDNIITYIRTNHINIDNPIKFIINFGLINSLKYLIDNNIIDINHLIDNQSLLYTAYIYNSHNIIEFLVEATALSIPTDEYITDRLDRIKKDLIKRKLTSIDLTSDPVDIIVSKINTNVEVLSKLYNENTNNEIYRITGSELFREYSSKFSWCVLKYEGALNILNIINYIKENSEIKLLLLEVGGGSGLNSAYLDHVQTSGDFKHNITIKCTDPELDIEKYRRKFYEVEPYDALESIVIYKPNILFVSRARSYITDTTKFFMRLGGLIIIMLGEECYGESDRSCAPSSFYELIESNGWHSYKLKNSIIEWHLFGEHDVCFIYYSPALSFLPEYLEQFN